MTRLGKIKINKVAIVKVRAWPMLSRFQKVLLISLLVSGMLLPSEVSFVSSAAGNIFINSMSNSKVGQIVQSGGQVNLYLGYVMWATDASTMYLFLSTDNSPTITSGDFVYTPQFTIANVDSATGTTSYSDNDGGAWVVGNGWVNGTIAQNLALGNYYIKAFDQSSNSSEVAVTDTYITVNMKTYNSTLNLTPSAGPGGVTIQFTGSSYPPNAQVAISYYNPTFGTWNLMTTTTANQTGNIIATFQAPDLQKSLPSGDCPQQFNQISYSASVNSIVYATANYDEYERGLSMVGNAVANGLYGNGTNLDTTVKVMPGDSLTIAGQWFCPGVVYIRWDGSKVVGTVTADQWQNVTVLGTTAAGTNGTFETTVIIPQAETGDHYIQIEDSQTWMVVTVFLSIATLSVTPSSGPGGATVQFTGTRYPASTAVNITYLNPTYDTWDYMATTTSDSSGNIALSFQIPDLQYVYSQGDSGSENASLGALSFNTEINGAVWAYVTYNEQYRGLEQVGNASASGLYGNGTNLASSITVTPGSSIVISGEGFHPGIIYIRFDGSAVVGTVTASQWQSAQILASTAASAGGDFSTYVTIPPAEAGSHFIQVEDSQTWTVVTINVAGSTSPTPTPTPYPSLTPTPTPSPTAIQTPSPTPAPKLPSPNLSFYCISSTTTSGFNVQVQGSLTYNGVGLSGAGIRLSGSVTGGVTWQDLTYVNTDNNGSFTCVWNPSVSGNYGIKATWSGNSDYSNVSAEYNFAIAPFNNQEQNVFSATSNSTLTSLSFDSTTDELSFGVSGPSGTTGVTQVCIPQSLIPDISKLTVMVDGTSINYTSISEGNVWLITFTYHHSSHTVVIALGASTVPEFPTWVILPLFAIAILLSTAFIRKRIPKK